jgi:enoyl-CoA hydratase/carnithine racemase
MAKYCRTEREDKLLVVTLDRPDVNSLNAPACFEFEARLLNAKTEATLCGRIASYANLSYVY